jgi:hypothetical protein
MYKKFLFAICLLAFYACEEEGANPVDSMDGEQTDQSSNWDLDPQTESEIVTNGGESSGDGASLNSPQEEAKVLTTLELTDTHTVKFLEVESGIMFVTEKYKVAENKPALNSDFETYTELYRELAGKKANAESIETLMAADKRVAARLTLIAQMRSMDESSAKNVQTQNLKEDNLTQQKQAVEVGAVDVSANDLVQKDSCSYSQSVHDSRVSWFRDEYCFTDSDWCYALRNTRYRWIDHISFKTSKRVTFSYMNAQRCNDVEADLWYATECDGWSACSRGKLWNDDISPGWAIGGVSSKGDDITWEPNIYGSGRDADKDVFLSGKY